MQHKCSLQDYPGLVKGETFFEYDTKWEPSEQVALLLALYEQVAIKYRKLSIETAYSDFKDEQIAATRSVANVLATIQAALLVFPHSSDNVGEHYSPASIKTLMDHLKIKL